jgi:hypothetical protein
MIFSCELISRRRRFSESLIYRTRIRIGHPWATSPLAFSTDSEDNKSTTTFELTFLTLFSGLIAGKNHFAPGFEANDSDLRG